MLWALLACVGDVPGTEDGRVVLELINPTVDADPFADLEQLRLELLVDDQIVATTVGDAASMPALPDLYEFGVGRFRMSGLIDGQVVSLGRTGPVLLDPGVDQVVPMVFLPVNQVLPLVDEMGQPRSQHLAVALSDGRVLLGAGRSPSGDTDYADLQSWTPVDGFQAVGELPTRRRSPTVLVRDTGETWLVGGQALVAGELRSASAVAVVEPDDTVKVRGDLSAARAGGCVADLEDGVIVALGGAPEATVDVWNGTVFEALAVDGLDASAVADCVALEAGVALVLGTQDDAAVGLLISAPAWSWRPLESGRGAVVDGMSLGLSDGDVWVGGGQSASAQALSSAGVFDLDTESWSDVPGTQVRLGGHAVPWVTPDHGVLGCGTTADGLPHPTVEVVELRSGQGISAPLDRERSGCQVSALPDGTVLVSGGFSVGQQLDAGAAILVPWLGAQ